MTSYEKVNNFLDNAKGSKLGLERIKQLLEYFDNPQEKLKIIHVSGTNGKGSFSSMLSSVLYQAGYCIGYFSSPSITTVNDSFRINCKAVSDELFTDVMEKVIEKACNMQDKPTEFELMTAAAYQMFFQCKCDICIIECGLGGDEDATNIISSSVLSVITNVQKDHCHILGNTIVEIAHHKSGIIKKKCPVLYGGENNEAVKVIKNKACEMFSRIYITDFKRLFKENYSLKGTKFSFGNYDNIYMPLLGMYQTYNAANVLTAIEILGESGYTIDKQSVYIGFKKCSWHGRFEVMSHNPVVIFDGAHNPDGLRITVKSIKHYFDGQPVVFLIGVMADKEYRLYSEILRDIADMIFTVTPDNPRALKCDTLCDVFKSNGINAQSSNCFLNGVSEALKYAKGKGLPLFALGSLYMYDEFKRTLEQLIN